MEIKINGESKQVDPGATIGALLTELGIGSENLAVEHNGEFLEEDALGETALNEGDTLEIVRFVGGG